MSGIVVSLDRSADSQQALEWAVTHATREHTPLTVLAVRSVTVRGFIGQPADALIEASHDADMVVVEERSGLARFLTRSVSAQVTQHAACPVVVISGQK